jgi:hypothetical protein
MSEVGRMVARKIIKTPEKVGRVTIADYNGMILTLIAEDGKKLTFNVATEKFSDE